MFAIYTFLLAGFTAPLEISPGIKSLLWFLPLSATVSIVYKVINLNKITATNFIKEVAVSFISIVVVIVLAILGMYLFDIIALR